MKYIGAGMVHQTCFRFHLKSEYCMLKLYKKLVNGYPLDLSQTVVNCGFLVTLVMNA